MDITLETYQKFLSDAFNEMPINDKKIKKKLSAFQKKISKLDKETFNYLVSVHINYISSAIMDDKESNNGFINTIQYMKNFIDSIDESTRRMDDDFDDDEDYDFEQGVHRGVFKVLDDDIGSLTNNDFITMPSHLQDIQWVMNEPMTMTIASNNTIWMNNSLWEYLIDVVQFEAYGRAPIAVKRPDPPDELILNIGYNKHNMIISLGKGVTCCMKVKFKKQLDRMGRPYGTVDDETGFHVALDSSFKLKGKYIFKPTTVMGALLGEKIKDNEI